MTSTTFTADQMEWPKGKGAGLIKDTVSPILHVRAFDDTTPESVYIITVAPPNATKVTITLTARGDHKPVAFLIVAHVRATPNALRQQPLGHPDNEQTRAFMAAWALTGAIPTNIEIPTNIAPGPHWRRATAGPYNLEDLDGALEGFTIVGMPREGAGNAFLMQAQVDYLE